VTVNIFFPALRITAKKKVCGHFYCCLLA